MPHVPSSPTPRLPTRAHCSGQPSKRKPRERGGNVISKNKITPKIKLGSNAQLPGQRHRGCCTGNTWSAPRWQRTPRHAAVGGLEGMGWLHTPERDHCPLLPSATRGTQTTFSMSQEKAGAGNTCFRQTDPHNVGGLGAHPLLTHRAEPWEALQGSRSLASAPRRDCPSFSVQGDAPWGRPPLQSWGSRCQHQHPWVSAPASALPPASLRRGTRRKGGRELAVHTWPNGSLGPERTTRFLLNSFSGCF